MNQCHTQPAINGAAAVGCHSGGTKDSALNAAAVAAADAVIPLVEDGPMVGLLAEENEMMIARVDCMIIL